MNYYELPIQEVVKKLSSDSKVGLQENQLSEQIVLYGSNVLPERKGDTFLKRLARQFTNPLAIILIGAAILTIFLHEYVDTVVIAIAVVVNMVVALIQEGKASEAYKLLSSKRIHKAIVIRSGEKQEVLMSDLVVGDLVVLNAGLYVPADIRVLEATNLSANQVIFTGESIAVTKDSEPSSEILPFEQTSMVFTGSTIASGSGLGKKRNLQSKNSQKRSLELLVLLLR